MCEFDGFGLCFLWVFLFVLIGDRDCCRLGIPKQEISLFALKTIKKEYTLTHILEIYKERNRDLPTRSPHPMHFDL